MPETPVDTGDSRPRVSVVDAWLSPMSTTVREEYEVGDLDPAGVLEAAAEAEQAERRAAFRKLQLAAHWADLHPATTTPGSRRSAAPPCWPTSRSAATAHLLVAAFTPEPFALALGMSPSAGAQLIADALDLRHRLPLSGNASSVGGAGLAGPPGRPPDPPASKAAAIWVDEQLADRGSCGPVVVDRLVAQAIAAYDPETHEDREDEPRPAGTSPSPTPRPPTSSAPPTSKPPATPWSSKTFYDHVCAIAHQLFLDGDTDPLGVRKIKALGILTGQPAAPGKPEGQGVRPGRRPRPQIDGDGGSTLAAGQIEKLGAATLTKIRDLGRPPPSRHPTRPQHGPPRRRRLPRPTRLDARPRPPPRRTLHLPQMPRRRPVLRPRPHDPLQRERTTRPNHPENLACLCRRHHRAKTTGRWRYLRTPDGDYQWHGPYGTSTSSRPRAHGGSAERALRPISDDCGNQVVGGRWKSRTVELEGARTQDRDEE